MSKSTNGIYRRTLPSVRKILEARFPNSEYKLTDEMYGRREAEFLDRYCGIDGFIVSKTTGQKWSVQTKVRDYKFLRLKTYPDQTGPDITIEHKNNYGLPNETPGEWFYLMAGLYLYGWESAKQDGRLHRWVVYNVPSYKAIIEREGGLDAVGQHRVNDQFSKASFYTVPLETIDKAIVAASGTGEWWL